MLFARRTRFLVIRRFLDQLFTLASMPRSSTSRLLQLRDWFHTPIWLLALVSYWINDTHSKANSSRLSLFGAALLEDWAQTCHAYVSYLCESELLIWLLRYETYMKTVPCWSDRCFPSQYLSSLDGYPSSARVRLWRLRSASCTTRKRCLLPT